MWLFALSLVSLLWPATAQLLISGSGESSGLTDINGTNSGEGPVIVDGPTFYYQTETDILLELHFLQCDVRGSPPLQVSWLLSSSPVLADGGYRVEMTETYSLNANESSITHHFTFDVTALLSPEGYYFCRVNNSIGLALSRPYLLIFYEPYLTSVDMAYNDNSLIINLEIKGFPLPLLYVEHFYIIEPTSLNQNVNASVFKYALNQKQYTLIDSAQDHSNVTSSIIDFNETSDDSVSITMTYPIFVQLMSVQLLVEQGYAFDSFAQLFFELSGHPYLQINSASLTENVFTLSCVCSECDRLIWKKDAMLISVESYNVSDTQTMVFGHHTVNWKYSFLTVNSGYYSCTSNNNNETFINIPRLPLIIQPPQQYSTQISGEEFSINCTANGSDPLIVDWLLVQGNTSVLIDRDQYIITSNSIGGFYKTVTSTVTFTKIEGMLKLRCRATNFFFVQPFALPEILFSSSDHESLFDRSKIHNVTEYSNLSVIEILYPANVSSNMSSITVNETDPVILWCSAYGNPLPVITWYYFNEPISSNDYLTITTPSANESHLIIHQTRYDRDEGVYTCEATNDVINLINATQTHNINLTVQVPPVLTILGNEGPAVVGTNVTLSVNISNARPPVDRDNITWSVRQMGLNKSDILVVSPKYKFSDDKRNLTIISVSSSDEGEYRINVSHPTGETSAITYLRITDGTDTAGPPSNSQTAAIAAGLSTAITVSMILFTFIVIVVIMRRRHRAHQENFDIVLTNMRRRNELLDRKPSLVNREYIETFPASLMIMESQLKILDCIGQGEFGKVYRGHYYNETEECITVAVKTLKDVMGRYSRDDINEFFEESLVMQNFDHPNVMGLIGVCIDAGPAPYIVLPFMEGGSLLKYLTKNRSSLMTTEDDDDDDVTQTRTQLLTICFQIGKGMRYIAEQKLVHRDLAARNCMIDDKGIVKVSDFGLSKDVYEHVYFREAMTSGVKLPIKWMAIESIQDGIFTEKTDVWSFGITVWEVFNGGMAPYGGFSPANVKSMIMDGYRLDPPSLANTACNDDIYQKIMLKCWEKSPEHRPTFAEIVPEIEAMLSSSAGYLELTLS